jgi:hypothetical protein
LSTRKGLLVAFASYVTFVAICCSVSNAGKNRARPAKDRRPGSLTVLEWGERFAVFQPMCRYFFDLIDMDRIVTDCEGEEFACAEDAKAHALRIAAELARNTPREGNDKRWISIRDEPGVVIFSVSLLSQSG